MCGMPGNAPAAAGSSLWLVSGHCDLNAWDEIDEEECAKMKTPQVISAVTASNAKKNVGCSTGVPFRFLLLLRFKTAPWGDKALRAL
jgi:hypothetical protein